MTEPEKPEVSPGGAGQAAGAPANVQLYGARRKGVGYNPIAVAVILSLLGFVLGAMLVFKLLPSASAPADKPVVETPQQAVSPAFASSAPKDYEHQPAAAPPPAVPTVAPAALSAGGSPQPISDSGHGGGSDSKTEDEIAHASGLFFSRPSAQQTRGGTAPADVDVPAPSVAAAALLAHANGAPGLPAPYGDKPIPANAQQGLVVEKNNFIMTAGAGGKDYVDQPLQHPRSPYEIKAGTLFSASLVTGINSDLPGEIVAQVSENVYDTATGRFLLVPQGSRLIGKYDSLISYGQNRALLVWTRLILPNANSIDLGSMSGTDETGTSGLEDETNHHRLALAGALAASTVLSVGPSLAQSLSSPSNSGSGTTTNIYETAGSTLGQQGQQIGTELLSRELNRPNTITIRPGFPLRVLINKDLVMEPYRVE